MSFNIKSSFVTRSVVEDNKEKQLDSSEKAKAQEQYDPRTLYERLQEQKAIKEEKLAEEARFANHIKRLAAEEIEYYKTLSDEKEKLEFEQKAKERLELEEFRQAVEISRSNPVDTTTTTVTTAVTTTASTKPKPKPSLKSNKKDSLKGALFVKKKKRQNDDDDNDEGEAEEQVETKKLKTSTKKEETKSSVGSLSLLSAYGDASSSSDSE